MSYSYSELTTAILPRLLVTAVNSYSTSALRSTVSTAPSTVRPTVRQPNVYLQDGRRNLVKLRGLVLIYKSKNCVFGFVVKYWVNTTYFPEFGTFFLILSRLWKKYISLNASSPLNHFALSATTSEPVRFINAPQFYRNYADAGLFSFSRGKFYQSIG